MRLLFPLIACLTIAACSDAERDAAADADGNGSLSAETAGVKASDGPATIDCARASGQAEQAICADKELMAIDKSMVALAGAAAADPVWVALRQDCSRSDDLRQCLLDVYGTRIHDLAITKPGDGQSIVGPVAYRCADEELAATFINSEPGAIHLRTGESKMTLVRVAAASGVKYEGRVEGRLWTFWSKGRETTLIRDGAQAKCVEVPKDG